MKQTPPNSSPNHASTEGSAHRVAMARANYNIEQDQRERWVRRQLFPGAWPAMAELLRRARIDPHAPGVGDAARLQLATEFTKFGEFRGNARLRFARDELDRFVLRSYGSEHAVYVVSQFSAIPMKKWCDFVVEIDDMIYNIGEYIVGNSLWAPVLNLEPTKPVDLRTERDAPTVSKGATH